VCAGQWAGREARRYGVSLNAAIEVSPAPEEGQRERPPGADYLGTAMRPSRRFLLPTTTLLVARTFGETFLGALATFVVIDLLTAFIDKFDPLVAYGLLREAGIEYLLLKLPLMTAQLMPVACLAGVLLGLGMLNRNGELLALQGLGISRIGIAIPLLFMSALLSIVAFWLNESIAPAATRRSNYLLYNVIQKQPEFVYNAQNWLRTRDAFVKVWAYDPVRKRLAGVRIYQIGPQYTLRAILSADAADWNGTEWVFSGLKVLNVDHHDGPLLAAPAPKFQLDARPGDFSFAMLDPEEFSLPELDDYIDKLRRNGLEPGAYLVDRDVKFALPLSCLVMMVCGLALSLDPVPRASSAGRGFILGFGIGLFYWVILGFTVAFGRSGVVPPWLAAWFPNVVFFILGASLFLTGEER